MRSAKYKHENVSMSIYVLGQGVANIATEKCKNWSDARLWLVVSKKLPAGWQL